MIRDKKLAVIGAIFITTAIVLGAFGAHALKNILEPELLESYKTSTDYLLFHGLAFLVLSLFRAELKNPVRLIRYGMIIFCFSIFALLFLKASKVDISGFIALITPFGGLMMIAGWIWTTIAISQSKEHKSSGK